MSKRLQDQELEPFKQFLATYVEAYSSLDIDQMNALIASDAHCWGTGSDEQCINRQQYTNGIVRDFSELNSVSLSYDNLDVFQDGDSACLCSLFRVQYSLKTSPSETLDFPLLRFTIFLTHKERDIWRIVHIHASAALGTQAVGESYPSNQRCS